MKQYVNVKATERTQSNLCEKTFELLKDYAEERWFEDTYVLRFNDTIPASIMKKLTRLTDTYPHDTVILTGGAVTFLNLGGHTNDSIAFEVEITRKTWKQIARRFAKKLNCSYDLTDNYLMAVYTIYVLSGGSIEMCNNFWTPTVIRDYYPEKVLAVV